MNRLVRFTFTKGEVPWTTIALRVRYRKLSTGRQLLLLSSSSFRHFTGLSFAMGRLKEAFLAYEEAVVSIIELGYDCTRSDAQAIAEAAENEDIVVRCFQQATMPIHCVLLIMAPAPGKD